MRAVSELLGVGTTETVRKWVRQAEIDDGSRPGVSTEESAELKRLKRENAELQRANAILKTASAFFAAELGSADGRRGPRSTCAHAAPADTSSTNSLT